MAPRLRCGFQKLAGEVTEQGLWLHSTVADESPARFRVRADYVGREGGAMVALAREGRPGCEAGWARFVRRGLVEEYSVSADGGRQDFVVPRAPGGVGPLRVELRVEGAEVKSELRDPGEPGGRDFRRAQASIPAGGEGNQGSAEASPSRRGLRLVLDGSGRELAYHRLRGGGRGGARLVRAAGAGCRHPPGRGGGRPRRRLPGAD